MLCHLKMIDETRPDGSRWMVYADADVVENWINDPCTFCGGESFPAVCPGDGRPHRHGGIHLPDHSGYGYLCRSPECKTKAEAAWEASWKKNWNRPK